MVLQLANVSHMERLQALCLSHIQLSEPDIPPQLTALTKLELYANGLDDLPDLSHFPNLVSVLVKRQSLSFQLRTPICLAALPHLQCMLISYGSMSYSSLRSQRATRKAIAKIRKQAQSLHRHLDIHRCDTFITC